MPATRNEAEPALSDRIESEFLATVSHELRTPLNAIVGFSEILAESDRLDERQRRYAAHILAAGRKLTLLINDLLEVRRLKDHRIYPRVSKFSAESVLAATAQLFGPSAAAKSIRLECRCVGPIPPLIQDPARLRQVLHQLVSNAIKFTPEGGFVDLTAGAEEDYIVFAVSDTGPGIAEEERELVFEAFRQGGRSRRDGAVWTRPADGLGLGLALARGLTERLGGSLGLMSRVGEGSTFTVHLPRVYPDLRGCARRPRFRGPCVTVGGQIQSRSMFAKRNGRPQGGKVFTSGRDGQGNS
jgi:signal transduction histidine kinase